jgi:hypothetical protein
MTAYEVFLSHAVGDAAMAERLQRLLEAQGLRCFLSGRSIEAGGPWREEILRALQSAKVVVFVLTPASVESNWILYESAAAWALEKWIVPCTQSIRIHQVPELLAQYQCRPINSDADRAQLADEVRRLCARPPAR